MHRRAIWRRVGTKYLSLIGQPILIYGADRPALSRALERALSRNVTPAVYTEDMFRTTHDAANREVVRAVIRAELNLVGLAMRAERKVIDKIVDGLEVSQLGGPTNSERKADVRFEACAVGRRMAASGDDHQSKMVYNHGVKALEYILSCD